MNISKEYKALKREVNELNKDLSMERGRLANMKSALNELGYNSIEEAEEALIKLEKSINKQTKHIENKIKEIKGKIK